MMSMLKQTRSRTSKTPAPCEVKCNPGLGEDIFLDYVHNDDRRQKDVDSLALLGE